jgi:hypothetical protein
MSKSDLKFKVGDRIEICGHWDADSLKASKYQGLKGAVISIGVTPPKYGVKFDKYSDQFHSCNGTVTQGHGYWMHARNMKKQSLPKTSVKPILKVKLKVEPKVEEKPTLKVGTRIIVGANFNECGYPFGLGTIVEVHPLKRQLYLAQFDNKHEDLHDGMSSAGKKYADNTCYWLASDEFKVPIEPKAVVIPSKIGEFNVIPVIHPFKDKFYLQIDSTKPMVFTTTQHAYDDHGLSIDIIAVLPNTCYSKFISASGSLNDIAFIICPREYTPTMKMTLAEIEEKLGFKIEVV